VKAKGWEEYSEDEILVANIEKYNQEHIVKFYEDYEEPRYLYREYEVIFGAVLKRLAGQLGRPVKAVDLCGGAGKAAFVIKQCQPDCEVFLVDIADKMLEIASDNRNRTASEIRHLFSKHGGNLGETGCVSWMFKRVGLISIDRQQLPGDEEEFLLHALELGVEDVRDEGDYLEVVTSPETFMDIRDALEEEEIPMEQVDIVLLPENTVDINTEELAAKVIKLIELLEDHDDVQNAYSNASIPDEILEKMA